MCIYILHKFFLPDFQLQHNGTELHVEVVGSFQLPLIVLPDVQCMPEGSIKKEAKLNSATRLISFYQEKTCLLSPSSTLSLLTHLSSSLLRRISSSSSLWMHVPSLLIFSKCFFTSSLHSACNMDRRQPFDCQRYGWESNSNTISTKNM